MSKREEPNLLETTFYSSTTTCSPCDIISFNCLFSKAIPSERHVLQMSVNTTCSATGYPYKTGNGKINTD